MYTSTGEWRARPTAAKSLLALALLALFCGWLPHASAQSAGQTIFAVTVSNKLVQFSSAAPGALTAQAAVSGLEAGEQLVGLDFRPATGQLLALGSTNRLYTLDPNSGAATPIGTQPFTTTVLGTAFGFDFNPSVDRIRLVSDTGTDLRLNPITGGVAAADGKLAYATGDANAGKTPGVVSAGYTNNISGTAATQLYALDATQDVLVKQGTAGPPVVSPNTGQLFTVGALGVDIGPRASFDIAQNGAAFVTYAGAADASSKLGTIDLATGKITEVGTIGGELLAGIAIPTATAPGESVYAVTITNKLLRFRSGAPGAVTSSQAISGLQTGEFVLGIDFRPATGQLLALGSTNRLYTLDPNSGAATPIGTQPFTTTVLGTAFGFDFNPSVDRIRLVSDSGTNLRLNPITGGVAAADGSLAYAPADANAGKTPSVVGAGYTNNISGTAATQLYALDATQDVLVKQGTAGPPVVSPNTGQLFTVGALGVDIGPRASFDISQSGAAYVTYAGAADTSSKIGMLDLATGKITEVGTIGGGELIAGIAIQASAPPRARVFLPLVVR